MLLHFMRCVAAPQCRELLLPTLQVIVALHARERVGAQMRNVGAQGDQRPDGETGRRR